MKMGEFDNNEFVYKNFDTFNCLVFVLVPLNIKIYTKKIVVTRVVDKF